MRIIFVTSLIFTLFLTSCVSSPTSEPASTVIAISPAPSETISPTETFTPQPTETLSPTQTFTPEPTATVTPPPIPDFMNEYIERGFDTVSSDHFLCFVIEDAKVHYSPLEGVVYKERVIRSWLEVAYILDGEFRHGIILEYVRRGGGNANSDFTKMIYANSGQLSVNAPVAYIEAVHKGWEKYTPTEHTIACGILGLNPPSETPLMDGVDFERLTKDDFKQNGVDLLFDGIFPVVDGKAQPVTINGIGEVLPITQCYILPELLVEQK